MFELTVKDEFAAAHYLRDYPGACERLHGHNWKVEIAVRGEKLNEIDVLIDFKDLKKHLKEVLDELDHQNLNEHPAFQDKNPSSENIARYIFEKLAPKLKPYGVELIRVTVCETERACASFVKA
ncbi:6-pyruvoyl tetrahydropterin synthase [Thermodesulfatator indicus DSM 15286]|uniref:6-carboxy-5,6,7,8-tetrahydropterin synthase n=1 Tax=Thermodesulfatator indicus (strain DSM 15286 / JCM 11887 / CIR29812) TaxID=667014 RepID=F8ACX9_THEID|nr:6-carboxytetrahydropterin synthase QueD [Thermodesulfatator indicus]AEH44773.1 6-pyruvoyl tetrahydropterin synthase [Thermodesulfatator indicus DSM 15286]